MFKFEEMNETDVRENIVHYLLKKLGYEQGTHNTIRTEQTFRYGRHFLGRKNAKKDPAVSGRADYILDVIGVGRWVVEVKAPYEDLSRDVVEQAHTYAAHPEVAALFFLITNGRRFELYRTSALSSPLMAWEFAEIDEILLALYNLVGPDAIRRKMKVFEPDKGKPLARNISSKVQIIGGYVRYEDHISNHPMLDVNVVNGLELSVTGGSVFRTDDGKITAEIRLAKSAPMIGMMSDSAERDVPYPFDTSAEYISVDPAAPTIFQGIYKQHIAAGTPLKIPGIGNIPMPFSLDLFATTEAIGFVEDGLFKGAMQLRYDFSFSDMPLMVRAGLQKRFGVLPEKPYAEGGGMFEIKLLNL